MQNFNIVIINIYNNYIITTSSIKINNNYNKILHFILLSFNCLTLSLEKRNGEILEQRKPKNKNKNSVYYEILDSKTIGLFY